MGVSYLLDTNAWISYLNRRRSQVADRIAITDPAVVRLCSVVKAELYYGAYHSSRTQENLSLLRKLYSQFASLPFDDAAADEYGKLRAHLAKLGMPIGPNDLMIGAIALSNGLTLVTKNTREFGRIPGLLMEDWESGPSQVP